MRDDRGGFLGRIWTLREVTQQRELDRLKDEFVATVSHELRTPLTSMMGFLEMIREGEAGQLTDEQKRFLAIVYRSSERLQRLVGDLLFVARLDASGLQLQFAAVRSSTRSHARCVESSSALARSREIELETELGRCPVRQRRPRAARAARRQPRSRTRSSSRRPAGRVTVRTFVDGDNAVLEVEDTGIGIPEAEQDRAVPALLPLVDRHRAGDSRHRPRARDLHARSSRRTAERSTCARRPGAGTCFRVELPLEPGGSRRMSGRGSSRSTSAPRRCARSPTTSAESRSPATRTSRYALPDADELVDACRAVLAQVGEGDALAISCFWHSLVAARRARPAADAGAHLARSRRATPPGARSRPTTTGAPAASCTLPTGRRRSVGSARTACGPRGTSRSATTCCSG